MQHFRCFCTQLSKKLQQWSIYGVIEDIPPFILNTKLPLRGIWLLRYLVNNLVIFQQKLKICVFGIYPNFFCFYIRDQISLRGYFVFKTNKRISSINSNNDRCCSFLKSRVIMQQKTVCWKCRKMLFLSSSSVQAFYFTQKQISLSFRGGHSMYKSRLLKFWRYCIFIWIESRQTEH